MRSDYNWNKLTEASFVNWMTELNKEENLNWVIITFKGRIAPYRVKKQEADLINANLMSAKNIGRGFTKDEITKGFKKFVKQLDIKFLPNNLRRKGIKLKRIPFFGGDSKNGIWNHIHAYVQLPPSVSYEEFVVYMKNIAQKKMESVCLNKGLVEADVWCEPRKLIDEDFMKYSIRPEGEFLNVKLDKVMIEQVFV